MNDLAIPIEAASAADASAMAAWIVEHIGSHADRFDAEQSLPPELLGELAERRLLAAAVPVSHGGLGLDAHRIGEICEALGHASGSVLSLFTVHSMVAVALARWGSAQHKQAWLGAMADGKTLAALAISEPDAGSDISAIGTRLRVDGDTIVVSGSKRWISFGQIADLFLVGGVLDGQLAMVLVERDTPGLEIVPIRDMLGFRAGMLAQLEFRDCVVPAANLLGRPGFGLSQIVGSVLDHGRYCIAWGCAGLARACLEASLDYADRRSQFGKPLREHPLIQALITDMMVDARAARLMCGEAAQARAQARPDLIQRATAAKYFAARVADQAASAALQIHGANGCSDRFPVQRYLRDAKVMNIIEGSTQIQQMLVAEFGAQWIKEWNR